MHALIFFCLICGQKFIKQLNEILHNEFDEVLIHHERITECPTCNQLCTSREHIQQEEEVLDDSVSDATDEGEF